MPNLSTLLSTPQRQQQIAKTRHAQSSPAFGDRFIPNRANMDIDRCSASIRTGEKRRLDALPKAASARRRRHSERNQADEDPTSQPMPISQRQLEFNRQMEAVLFGIPRDRLEPAPASSSVARSDASSAVSTFDSFISPNLTQSTPRDPSNLAYATIPELLEEANDSSDTLRRHNNSENLLSFGSSNASGSSSAAARHNRTRPRLPDPFNHDILHILQRSAHIESHGSSNNSGDGDVIRRVKSSPLRVLEAPGLVDDYYLNLISWSAKNIVAIALSTSVWLFNYSFQEAQQLLELPGAEESMERGAYVTSVSWSKIPGQEHFLAVGTSNNTVQIWDTEKLCPIRVLEGHNGRICSMAWNSRLLSSGSGDAMIHNHDIRANQHVTAKLKGHSLQVCGLKWNVDGTVLASGGNDNCVCIWDASMSRRRNPQSENDYHQPRHTMTQHTAAIKALAWSPFRRHKLATGGGSADRTIMTWNTANGAMLNSVDTGSQVCSLVWSPHGKEIVSAHGFSRNQLTLWKYPEMTRVQEFKKHQGRVLNMDISPDGRQVVSLSADETLCFWEMFEAPTTQSPFGICDLQLGNCIIR
jgi:cell division cycle protein 20 (cofactor of APC complex)